MAGCKAYASTAGFESVCEAMYLGKPILMVPAHIEQDCNAYDAKSGAGIISSDFNLQQLLEFAKDYHPNRDFVYWVRGAEYTLLNLLRVILPIINKFYSTRCIWWKSLFEFRIKTLVMVVCARKK